MTDERPYHAAGLVLHDLVVAQRHLVGQSAATADRIGRHTVAEQLRCAVICLDEAIACLPDPADTKEE